ncbi:MAG: hypothetical protein LC112_15965 [Flavobacteriales bacterium]|nr:hypothetical protein [Flavobacteriales bacterium]
MKFNQFLKFNLMAIVAVLFVNTAMSFKKPEKKAVSQTFYYSYSGMTEGDFADPGHWQAGDPGDCETEGLKPCTIIIQDNETLGGVLAGKDNQAVLDRSVGRKP